MGKGPVVVRLLPGQKTMFRALEEKYNRAVRKAINFGTLGVLSFTIFSGLLFFLFLGVFPAAQVFWAKVSGFLAILLFVGCFSRVEGMKNDEKGDIRRLQDYIAHLVGILPDNIQSWKLIEDYDQLQVFLKR